MNKELEFGICYLVLLLLYTLKTGFGNHFFLVFFKIIHFFMVMIIFAEQKIIRQYSHKMEP